MSPKQLKLGISYYAQAIGIYWRLRKYLKQHFLSDLNFPNSLEQEYFYGSKYYNRTKQYMHANHFFGELLCVLRRSKMDNTERKRFANLSACAPIFDDFFDKDKDELNKINKLLNNVENEKPETEEQKLAALFLQNILADVNNKTEFLNAANQLFNAQAKAKKQQRFESEAEHLWDISRQKGGYSGLMYALLLSHDLSDQEKGLAFELGAFGQFMDDVFDLYDDRAQGIFTLPNTSKTIKEIELFFESIMDSIIKKVENLDTKSQAKRDFVNILQIFAGAIRLAFQEYALIEIKYKISPKDCLQIERKHWIIDMEKPKNAFKMFSRSLNYLS
ncbi:MAG: hypothetical protein J7K39_02570 [Bacteroidales bacterium]|nr:hypothetical protein [Bacteroidales bacterium]